jgi:hypothetical protein
MVVKSSGQSQTSLSFYKLTGSLFHKFMPFFIHYAHSIASGKTGRIMKSWHEFFQIDSEFCV